MYYLRKKETTYGMIHKWLYKYYGKASYCQNNECQKKSEKYEWAKLKEKEYAFNRNNFIMMCKSCHRRYDATKGRKNYRLFSVEKTKKILKSIRLNMYLETKELSKLLGISITSISNYELGRRYPKMVTLKKYRDLAEKIGIKFNTDDFI